MSFVDTGADFSAPIDPALAETPAAAPGGMTVGGDPLALAAAPAAPTGIPGGTTDPFTPAGMTAPFGITGGTVPEAYGADLAIPDTGTFADVPLPQSDPRKTDVTPADTSYTPTADKIAGASPGTGNMPVKDTSTVTQTPTAPTGARLNAGAANPIQQFGNALQGLQSAAMGGNPQAQQIMNMIRQMMQQQMMGGGMGMLGQGQQYNPYMNQAFNPWMARMRMEAMRRRFLERQRERQRMGGPPGTAAAMNPRGGGGRGGRR